MVPNSRVKTGKKKGGQSGHQKYSLEMFEDSEVDETVDHKINECPDCHTSMNDTNHVRIRDEYQFKLIVKKVRHRFVETECPNCG